MTPIFYYLYDMETNDEKKSESSLSDRLTTIAWVVAFIALLPFLMWGMMLFYYLSGWLIVIGGVLWLVIIIIDGLTGE